MLPELADRIMADCRGAIGQVRFGFGSKRQVWAFEERHQLDAAGLAGQLAQDNPGAFLDFAVAFHDEFADVSNSWRVRDRVQMLAAGLVSRNDGGILGRAAQALVDDRLAVRHWLVAAFVSGPPKPVFEGLQKALLRAYLPQDQWALLSRLSPLADAHGWSFAEDSVQLLAALAQFSGRLEDRGRALELLGRFGGPRAIPCLTRAARGDADPGIRQRAAGLLERTAGG